MYSLCSFESLYCLSRLTVWSQTVPLLVYSTATKDGRVHCRGVGTVYYQVDFRPEYHLSKTLPGDRCGLETLPPKALQAPASWPLSRRKVNPCMSQVSSSQLSNSMVEQQFQKIHQIRSYQILKHINQGLCPKEMDLLKCSTWSPKTRIPEMTNQASPAELPWSQSEHILSPRSHCLTLLLLNP